VAPRSLTCCDVLSQRCRLEQRCSLAASHARKAEERGRHERKRGVVPWLARADEDKDGVRRTWALGIFPGGPWARRPQASLTGWAGTAPMGQAHLPFSNCSKIFQFPNRFKLANYENVFPELQNFPNLAWWIN
jgi:hypothetical protein